MREPAAGVKSADPDKTRSATDELRASSLTREFASSVPRLRSAKLMMADVPEVAISSPATTGKDDAAVAGTALPLSVSGPEQVTLPTGSAAIRAMVVIMTISRHKYFGHKYFTATSYNC